MAALLKFLKFLFMALVVVGVILGAIWMIYIKEWPVWSGASLVLLFIGIVIGWYVVKRILIRRRERQFVKQVVEQEKSLADVTGEVSSEQIVSLERSWADSLNILKQSHLAQQGDPLYVLPWYMMLGTCGSGKTSAIRSARLSSPFPEAPQPAGSGTRFCDWWFTEHAIILDTAGKYSTPVLDAVDSDEWQRLLSLLLAARKKEALNGLVVAVAADQLLEADGDVLEEEGRAIRLRLDELMRVLGARFPVYILVTKCDQIYGMEPLANSLPETFFKQPMGVINDDPSLPLNETISRTLKNISERLKDLRFMLLDKVKGEKTGLMLLPEELGKLQSGLENFMRGVFRANPYQETPLMRGIYFSSALQSGTPVSRYIQQLEYTEDAYLADNEEVPQIPGKTTVPSVRNAASDIIFMDVLSGTRRGLFLFDFFDSVLPADRWLNRPLKSSVRRFRVHWGLGMICWLALLGGGLGLVSTSYMLNRLVMNQYTAEFSKPVALSGNMIEDILILDRFRSIIIKMENNNKRWWIPRFGLTQSETAVIRLKKNFCRLFLDHFYSDINKKLNQNIDRITPDTPGSERGVYIANILSRLQFVNARIETKGLEYMKKLPPPSGAFLVLLDSRATPELARQYQDLYLYYSAWQDDSSIAPVTKQELTMQLTRLLTGPSGQYDFDWIQEWINSTNDNSSVIDLDAFWEGTGDSGSVYIEHCYTLDGKKKVDEFLSLIESVVSPSSVLTERINRFKTDYELRYIAAWADFATSFVEETSFFSSNYEMHVQAVSIGAGKIPAERFIEKMVGQLEPYAKSNNVPPWLKLAIEHDRISRQAVEGEFLKQATGFSKLANEAADNGKHLLNTIKSKKLELPDKNRTLEQINTVKAYAEFRKSQQDIAKSLTTKANVMRLAVDMFSNVEAAPHPDQAGDAGSPAKGAQFSKAQEALKSFEADMRRIGEDKIYWDIIGSTLNFFALFATREAGCSLQSQWESQVLSATSAASESSLQELLFGTQGTVWKFVNGPAAPFLRGGPQGYKSSALMGHRVEFNPLFIDFVNRGNIGRQKLKDSYAVRVKAFPIHINKEAAKKPQNVLLNLSCGDDVQSLNNMNFPAQKYIKWSAKKCGDTVLRIKFDTVTLERTYNGERGFINFISDFKNGERTFTPDDFPEQKNDLKEMGVSQIRLKYLFEGQNELLNVPKYSPLEVPLIITRCEERGQNEF